MTLTAALSKIGANNEIVNEYGQDFVKLGGQWEGTLEAYMFELDAEIELVDENTIIVIDGSGKYKVEAYHNGGADGCVEEIKVKEDK